jgi:hypothetical protein
MGEATAVMIKGGAEFQELILASVYLAYGADENPPSSQMRYITVYG